MGIIRSDGMKLIKGAPQGDLRPLGWGSGYGLPNGDIEETQNDFEVGLWLFNIENDPYEKQNIALQNPQIVEELLSRLNVCI
jgi:hypothetical protein